MSHSEKLSGQGEIEIEIEIVRCIFCIIPKLNRGAYLLARMYCAFIDVRFLCVRTYVMSLYVRHQVECPCPSLPSVLCILVPSNC
jgi:hypothetical protein